MSAATSAVHGPNEQFINNGTGAPFGDLTPGQGYRQRNSGILGGAQIGYNWQANNYVFGMEGTISGLDNKGSFLNTAFGAGDDVFSWRTNVLATVVGRAGFAVQNNLFYIKGGYAGVNNRLSVTDTVGPATGSGGQTHWANGWTVGAGWEYGITRNWIVGLEYNYAAFASQTYQLGGTFRQLQLRCQAARPAVGRRARQLQVRRAGHRPLLSGSTNDQAAIKDDHCPNSKAPALSGASFLCADLLVRPTPSPRTRHRRGSRCR
ncbi:opacity protein-like surface antigen [Bradyrhizobium sp. GM6.1]